MNIRAEAPALFTFGAFVLDTNRRVLFRAGTIVHLTPRSFDVLEHLVQQDGRLVTHEDLEKYVWYGASVTEANIAKHVQFVRQAIGDRAKPYVYLRTVPSRGFRFVSARRER